MTDPHTSPKQQLRQRETELRVLKEITHVIGSGYPLDELFTHVAECALRLLDAETVTIPIIDEGQTHYTYVTAAGRYADELVDTELPISVGLCGWVMRHQRAWWRGTLDLLEADERNRWEQEAGTAILVPLVGKQRFLGGIACMNKQGGVEFNQDDLELLTMFAGSVALAIEHAMAYEQLRKARSDADAYRLRLEKMNQKLVQANSELQFMAVHDPLTTLPNRTLIVDRIEQGIMHSAQDGQMALIMIDIDNFKEINDTLGHGAGDQVLVELGERFAAALRDGCTVGRLGGDEFAVVLPAAGIELALAAVDALQACLADPVMVSEQAIPVDASMGVAVYPLHGAGTSELMKCADVAMYSAKRNHHEVAVYNTQQNPYNEAHLELTRDLRNAIKRGEIGLAFQPKVDLSSSELVGVESLARWHHPQHGEVPPARFIPMLEQTGMIAEFTLQLLDKAVAYCKQCERAGYEISMAVNLSVHNLRDERLPEQIEDILDAHELDPARLILEITEGTVMDDTVKSVEVLNDLADIGIELAIDDFGTGYSSLGYLKHLPVRQLKIDRSFVSDMLTDRDDAVIVRSTIDLAHNLGLETVAEGVETEDVMNALAGMGCDQVQGYLLSRPLPAEEFFHFLQHCDWSVRPAAAA